VQGLICKGLKRNWAKIKEKGLNRKGFVCVEGYIFEYKKTWGFSVKFTEPAGFDWLDSVDQI
jgi:hypothetical protein